MIEEYELVVIGAGPTGLGAARRVGELGQDYVVLEAAREPGGLAASVCDDAGFVWDRGIHLHFSHYDYYDAVLDELLPPDEWLSHRRATAAWLHDRFVPYPVQSHLHHLPPSAQLRCLRGLLEVRRLPQRVPDNFRDWLLHTFGPGLAEEFLLPYNEKVWATPLDRLAAGWVQNRVAVPQADDLLQRLCLRNDDTQWGPNAVFRYPAHGGSGRVWSEAARRLPDGSLRLGDPVVEVDLDARQITTRAGRRFRYGALLSTLPLDELLRLVVTNRPLPSAAGLQAASTTVIGLGFRGPLPSALAETIWIYFADPRIRFHRLTVLSNLSPHNVPDPDGTWSVMAEIASSRWKPRPTGDLVRLVESQLQGLGLLDGRQTVESRRVFELPHGYPVPTRHRDRMLAAVLPELEQRRVWSRGRFGAWKYEVSNQDHSFMQGVEAVEAIVHGREEVTLFQPDLVNSRRNPFPYPEWHVAADDVAVLSPSHPSAAP